MPPKPLLRGWLHAVGAVAALCTTIILLVETAGDRNRFLSLLVFGFSMILLYVVSAVYHIGTWSERRRIILRTLDHANIFIFIAGAYTPICILLLTGSARSILLTVIWSLALAGAVASFFTLHLPRWVLILLYIGMGWIALFLLPQMQQAISIQPVLMLLGGGLLYTVGALIYALRWPNPLPHIFGFHELFHLLVIAGTVAITATIWVWIVPFSSG
ncbi:MAG: hemolysin III family protein [Blastochloris sp.]|nr:hemolysin III family protein [Blastochloris sp.]